MLSYPNSGAGRLQRLLSGHAALQCTSGTGLLPLCELAATTWREVENRDRQSLSPLAAASIRAMAGSIITTVLAGTGKTRWCEIAFARPSCGEIFLELYPGAKFICMHRSCLGVVHTAVQANPWGLARSAFQSAALSYPGNSVAAVAAYWVTNTGYLLDFEQAHPDACHRVRYEDLVRDPGHVDAEISSFLALDPVAPDWMTDDMLAADEKADISSSAGQVPVDWVPPQLTLRINQLLTQIGYQPIPASGR